MTLPDLVAEAAAKLAALPPPKNGQVRAVPDERTIRYYASLGLLDPPAAMRGRTALYAARHLAQVVAIKRMQGAGKSLAEITELWPQLDDASLTRMTGIAVAPRAARGEFWKREPAPSVSLPAVSNTRGASTPTSAPVELRIELAPGAFVTVAVPDGVSITSADVAAFRAAAAPLVTELARRGLNQEENP